MEMIEAASVVSFDFFDTLFKRRVLNPEDVFDIVGGQFKIENFRDMRREAQTEAFKRMHADKRGEITLEGIYEYFTEHFGEKASLDMMEAEYQAELNVVYPNPEVVALLLELQRAKKRVIVVSDMYLPKQFFKDALDRAGIFNVLLFVSSALNTTKRDSGEIFNIVIEQLQCTPDAIVHIGDNPLGDVQRPKEKGLNAWYYEPSNLPTDLVVNSLSGSIAYGVLNEKIGVQKPLGDYQEIGYFLGGALNYGFCKWIAEKVQHDEIDHVLFLSRDGFCLSQIVSQMEVVFPKHTYFLGSRTAFTLASIDEQNFTQYIPFFLSGSNGLSVSELLERIGVESPSKKVMLDLGLDDSLAISDKNKAMVAKFLLAYKRSILKVCQRNRRGLFTYLQNINIAPNSNVAIVDVGWSGSTQDAFENAISKIMPLNVTGYYLCLSDTIESQQRQQRMKMKSLVNSGVLSELTIKSTYRNRVFFEALFSAPHDTIIGWQSSNNEVQPIYDSGRGKTYDNGAIIKGLCEGILLFAKQQPLLEKQINVALELEQIVFPVFDFINTNESRAHKKIRIIKNFDAWGSSKNFDLDLDTYAVNS